MKMTKEEIEKSKRLYPHVEWVEISEVILHRAYCLGKYPKGITIDCDFDWVRFLRELGFTVDTETCSKCGHKQETNDRI